MLSKNRLTIRTFSTTILLSLLIAITFPGFTESGLAISGQNIASLTNQERAKSGSHSLSWSGALASSAAAKVNHMCAHDYWAHVAPDGTTPWSFVSAAGYAYTAIAENLAKGFSDDTSVVSGWMNSDGHRQNMLNQNFTDIGVASKNCNISGKNTTLVVAHYGATTTATAKPKVQSTANRAVQSTAAVKQKQTVSPSSEPAKTKSSKKAVSKQTNEKSVQKQEESELVKLLLNLLQPRNGKLLVPAQGR